MTSDDFLTVPEVAQRLRVNPATVRRWIEAGTIPAVKIGRSYRVELAQVQAVIDGHRTTTPLTVGVPSGSVVTS
ncbi:helix-turn-helix domain-containing protein [Nocardioides pantholopis]|uniref:helix-turn-helix domain-containing protein n=1 Tax=Nocardioides pantholopis TaxID=2483798 RepID=UPI000FD6E603|nr:helix-turn-helix domain-containing protein [Nocardioides pantholopis]